MKTYGSSLLAGLVLMATPASALAANEPAAEQVAIDRSWRIGSGLLWGGVATTSAGGLTLLGIIPTHRNLGVAKARRSLCEFPECIAEQEPDIQRWTRAQAAIAITGSLLAAGGLTLVGIGIWKRRDAMRRQRDLDKRTTPEWAIGPTFGLLHAGFSLRAHF